MHQIGDSTTELIVNVIQSPDIAQPRIAQQGRLQGHCIDSQMGQDAGDGNALGLAGRLSGLPGNGKSTPYGIGFPGVKACAQFMA